MNERRLIYLSGLPRSGSTLLCNILAMHSEIEATPSSYLHNYIINAYSSLSGVMERSDNLEEYQERINRCLSTMLDHWYLSHEGRVLIDKNRGWFLHLDILEKIDPNYKIIVTLRDLVGVFDSIEKQHKKTILIKHPEDRSIVSPEGMIMQRYKNSFAPFGLVGGTIKAISDLRIQSKDHINKVLNHIHFVRFEDLLDNPKNTLEKLFDFISVKHEDIDLSNIKQSTHELDSYYFLKYPHKIKTAIERVETFSNFHNVSNKIQKQIRDDHKDYYEHFYPESVK